ncbi:hypothetical protein TCAL_10148 [Tigriopus californicus]|uniref:Peptide-methionine (R)-S-oxide reductase n=1 Tax=Tigriopus californicus TaxID=6832 RepID=A0A553PGW6_TIGCA|nr:peptide methionine sulfoxide reductase MsrB-like [Tigriopus californicus]TRY76921.1 hypothetical protein TCAL_10148 [Tigriopus californicus]
MAFGVAASFVLLILSGIGLYTFKDELEPTQTSQTKHHGTKDLYQLIKDNPKALDLEDWRQVLDSETFRVTREFGTERAFTSPLNNIKNNSGTFQCSNCGQALFHAKAKYESGTGWPSFFDVISPKVIGLSTDFKIGYQRSEVHCSRCGAHLGHVFNDGPQPTGLRYCMNGVALKYNPGS